MIVVPAGWTIHNIVVTIGWTCDCLDDLYEDNYKC